jgi:hypothetical protein
MVDTYIQGKKILFGKCVKHSLVSIHTIDQFRDFAVMRHAMVHHFIDLLEKIRAEAKIPGYTNLVQAIEINISDEIGRSSDGTIHEELAHSTWRDWYLARIGVKVGSFTKDFPAVKEYNQFISQSIQDNNLSYLIGVLLFLEASIPTEFSFILLKMKEFFTDTDIKREKYLVDHIHHDASSHYPDLLHSIPPDVDMGTIQKGIDDIFTIKVHFYESLRT